MSQDHTTIIAIRDAGLPEGLPSLVRDVADRSVFPGYKQVYNHIAEHQGQLDRSSNSELTAQFTTPQKAVRCGIAIQDDRNSNSPNSTEQDSTRFHIGIDSGNKTDLGSIKLMASQMNKIVNPIGFCITDSVHGQIGELSFNFKKILDNKKLIDRLSSGTKMPAHVYHLRPHISYASEEQIVELKMQLKDAYPKLKEYAISRARFHELTNEDGEDICQNVYESVCQRRSKTRPSGRSKSRPPWAMRGAVFPVVPVVHRRDPRCFV